MTVLSKQERLRQLATRLAGEDEYFLGLLRISLHQRDRDIIVTLLRDAAEAGAGTAPAGVREALEDRQRVVIEWGKRCFGLGRMMDKIVRAARFFEEAAELVQAAGLPRDHALRAFNHVYSRPAGDMAQEVGGVANTLMALCGALGLSFDDCQRAEIERCLSKDPAHFAKRNEAKLREVDAALTTPGLDPATVEACARRVEMTKLHNPYNIAREIRALSPTAPSVTPEKDKT